MWGEHKIEDIPQCKDDNDTVNCYLDCRKKHNIEDRPECREGNDTVNGRINVLGRSLDDILECKEGNDTVTCRLNFGKKLNCTIEKLTF